MKKLNPETDGATLNIVDQNVDALKTLFPEVLTDGKIDFEALREVLGDYVDDRPERYSFTWNGKSRARRIAQSPSTGTLRPCPEQSVNWHTTEHLFIEGDNLEVLKLLQKSYHKRVKMLYIDPPYNTGKELIYPDKYNDNLDTYLKYTGQLDDEGFKLSPNSETSGRYHTNWLNMMLPRLKLARNLLRDDGIIFISIDDHEASQLRALCDEVFGEENWVGTVVWKNATDNNPTRVAVEHEYIHVFARQLDRVDAVWRTKVSDIKNRLTQVGREFVARYADQAERQAAYTDWFRDNKTYLWPLDRYKYIDASGIYTGSQSVHNPGREGYRYDVMHPKTGKPCKQPLMGYRFPPDTMDRMLEKDKVLFGDTEEKIIELKVYVEEFEDKLSSVITLDGRLGAYDVRELFPESSKVFTNPKPVRLLSQLMSFVLDEDDIVLDFFSGSCATAQALLELNEADAACRRFVMVQLPEPLDPQTEVGKNASILGCGTIADIGKERIRRFIAKAEASRAEKLSASTPSLPGMAKDTPVLDLGFKAFRLDSSNIKAWDANFDNLEAELFNTVENVKPDRTEQDVLYELLIKYGLDLAVPVEERTLRGTRVYIVGSGALIVCLANDISLDVVEDIAALKDELRPALMRVVFKDVGFTDDVVKTNAVQTLRQAGIEDVRSL